MYALTSILLPLLNTSEAYQLEFITKSESETRELGALLAKRLTPGAVVALRGGLGVGKTAFTRGLAEGLGITARVTSPTFTIVNEYAGTLTLFHFDLYRLGGSDELDTIGFYEYLDRGGITVIEWSEIMGTELPSDAVVITLERVDDNTRKITVDGMEFES